MYSMLQRKFIVIILTFSVLFSGCIMNEDKGKDIGNYITEPGPEEKFLNTMPGLFRGLSDNPLKENIIWISSVPIGAEVYAANINDSFEQTFPSFSEINKIKYYKGTTPLALESNPGENFILLKVKAKRFENISSIKNYIQVVEGSFENGDLVGIGDERGKELGRGLVNYDSSEIDLIKGLHTRAIETKLGYKGYDEVIHRDNLVVGL